MLPFIRIGEQIQFHFRWLLDAILEYTSVAHMPSIFSENAGVPVKALEVLPTRMENNQLHRYSKVLETNIGESHHSTKVLPTCPHLKWATPHPLNRTAPTNLYKAQKLLSLNLDAPWPSPQVQQQFRKDLLPDSGGPNPLDEDDWIGAHDSSVFGGADDPWSLLWIFLLLLVVCFFSYRYCRTRYRLRRRKPRLQKLLSAVAGPRNV